MPRFLGGECPLVAESGPSLRAIFGDLNDRFREKRTFARMFNRCANTGRFSNSLTGWGATGRGGGWMPNVQLFFLLFSPRSIFAVGLSFVLSLCQQLHVSHRIPSTVL